MSCAVWTIAINAWQNVLVWFLNVFFEMTPFLIPSHTLNPLCCHCQVTDLGVLGVETQERTRHRRRWGFVILPHKRDQRGFASRGIWLAENPPAHKFADSGWLVNNYFGSRLVV